MELSMQDNGKLGYITKDIYPDIARIYQTSSGCVERNVRTIVDCIWRFGNRELLLEFSRIPLDYKQTNARFFEILTEYLQFMYGGSSIIEFDYKNT